jgi:hypothetical protein
LAFRATLPTDGWSVFAGAFGTPDSSRLIYQANLVGGATPLRPEDRVYAVEGYPIDPVLFDMGLGELPARARWEAGLPLRYSLLRAGETVRIETPPKNWTTAAWLHYMTSNIDRAANTVATLILMVIAVVVFARRHQTAAARALLLLCSSVMAQWISGSLPDGVSVILYPSVRYLTLFFTYSIFGVLVAPTLLVFTLVFPHTKPWIKRRPWLLALPYVAGLFIWWMGTQMRSAAFNWIGTLLFVLLSIAALIGSVRRAHDPVSRAQLRWAGLGFILGLSISLLTYLPVFGLVGAPWDRIFRVGTSVGFLIVGVSLAVAVLRFRLFEIDLIIRRTLVYSVVTALLLLVYLASVVLLQESFVRITGQTSQAAVALSTLAIAALFHPLRLRVQEWIDHRFYRPTYDAEQIVSAFTRMAQDEADLGLITGELVHVIREAVQPTFAGVWLLHEREQPRLEDRSVH